MIFLNCYKRVCPFSKDEKYPMGDKYKTRRARQVKMTYEEIERKLSIHHEDYMRFREETSITRVLKRISWLLFDSGLTQSEIAKDAGLNRQTIHKLVKGQRSIQSMKLPTLEKLDKVALKHIDL